MKQQELNLIIENHKKWLSNKGGSRANLRYANLSDANLSDANLRYANLSDANLRYANLRNANLRYANLSDANLSDANLRYANLSDANLRYANLSDANLRYANLRNANLRYAIGNKSHIKSIQLEKYDICYTSGTMQIGCQSHKIKSWFKFTDEQISNMDCGALDWWIKWKDIIKNIIEISPCEPTKKEDNK